LKKLSLTILTNNFITTPLRIFPHEIGKLEAQPTEPVSLTFHSVLKKPYTVPSISAYYKIAVHLATQFQRRLFQKSTNQKQELPVTAMFVNESGRNKQSL
jgi:hypothetical protein